MYPVFRLWDKILSVRGYMIFGVTLCIIFLLFGDNIHQKYEDMKIARISAHIPSHSVGSDCLFVNNKVAILKRYLDKGNIWVYDVMVLDNNPEPLVLLRVPHSSITDCKE